MPPIKTLALGLGPIGRAAARLALRGSKLELVAAVDLDPAKVGRDLAELLGLETPTGVVVERDLAAVIRRRAPAVALLSTGSSLAGVRADLLTLAAAGIDVVSPCEELLLPEAGDAALAAEIDAAARSGGATIVGRGINPGFVLDFLPVVLSAACAEVRQVWATRIVDAGTRRRPLQEKVGAGLDPHEFERRLETGKLGHVGMRQSVEMVGRALGLGLDTVRQKTEAVIAERHLETDFVRIDPGRVAGIRDVGRGYRAGEMLVRLELQMAVGAADPHDEIRLSGDPPLTLRIDGGIPGDLATAALLVHTVPQAVAAEAGWRSILELPPARWEG